MKKRVISLILTICMLVSILPTQVFSVGGDRGRESAIAALSKEYGGEQAEAMFDAMVSMGLIDESGNQLTYKVQMDGTTYTLEEMRPFIEVAGADLSKTVTVDGKEVTLEFLKKLLEYQDEMAYLDAFFTQQNKQLSSEQQTALFDMAAQFAQDGVNFASTGTPVNPVADHPSYWPKDTKYISVTMGKESGNSYKRDVKLACETEGGVTYELTSKTGQKFVVASGSKIQTSGTLAFKSDAVSYPYVINLTDSEVQGYASLNLELTCGKGFAFINGKQTMSFPLPVYGDNLLLRAANNFTHGTDVNGENASFQNAYVYRHSPKINETEKKVVRNEIGAFDKNGKIAPYGDKQVAETANNGYFALTPNGSGKNEIWIKMNQTPLSRSKGTDDDAYMGAGGLANAIVNGSVDKINISNLHIAAINTPEELPKHKKFKIGIVCLPWDDEANKPANMGNPPTTLKEVDINVGRYAQTDTFYTTFPVPNPAGMGFATQHVDGGSGGDTMLKMDVDDELRSALKGGLAQGNSHMYLYMCEDVVSEYPLYYNGHMKYPNKNEDGSQDTSIVAATGAKISVHDTTGPIARDVNMISPVGRRPMPGETIYFSLEYNEAVRPGSILIDGVETAPLYTTATAKPTSVKPRTQFDDENTHPYIGNKPVYTYRLSPDKMYPDGLKISNISNTPAAYDLAGETLQAQGGVAYYWGNGAAPFQHTIPVEVSPHLTFESASMYKNGAPLDTFYYGEVSAKMKLQGDKNQRDWLMDATSIDGTDKSKLNRVRARVNNGDVIDVVVPTMATEVTEIDAYFTLPRIYGAGAQYIVSFEYNNSKDVNNPDWRVLRQFATLEQKATTLVDDTYVTTSEKIKIKEPALAEYESGKNRTFSLGETTQHELSVFVEQHTTTSADNAAEDFKWESSNSEVLNIAPSVTNTNTKDNNYIALTPMSRGTATISLTATNGTVDTTKHKVIYSQQFTVEAGGKSAVQVFPMKVMCNEGFVLPISTNVIDNAWKYDEDFKTYPKVTITEVDKTDVIWQLDTSVNKEVANLTKFTIPDGILQKISTGFNPTYTVSVEMLDINGTIVKGTGGIVVKSRPAVIKLERPTSYFITDGTKNLPINWRVENAAVGANESKVTITKNVNAEKQDLEGESGTLDVKIDTPKGLRDCYTISAQTKNTEDDTWSYDSFILYVYKDGGISILANGKEVSSLLLDNSINMSGVSSDAILSLNRNIFLKSGVALDNTSGQLSVISDRMFWNSSDSSAVSINYTESGAPRNIEEYDETFVNDNETVVVQHDFSPTAEFTIAGLKNGTTTIDATHKMMPQLKDKIDITVNRLDNKLYLFAVSPKCTTEVTYKNGKGESKTLKSNAKGEFAIFEESGIASDVKLSSKYRPNSSSDEVPYLGTILNSTLVSGERDGSKGELYPINQMRLRKPAEVKLIFQMPAFEGYQNNGASIKPFVGKVTLRGGVYRNGKLCPSAALPDVEVNSPLSFRLSANDQGMKTLVFDPTSFKVNGSDEEINGNDKIEYIFEAKYLADGELGSEQGTRFYPSLLKYSGAYSDDTAMRMGDNATLLRATASDAGKPFVVRQEVDRFKKSGRLDDVTFFKGNVGINPQNPTAELITTALWWGSENADAAAMKKLKLETVYDRSKKLPGLTTTTFKYPFSSIPVSETRSVITKRNIWLKTAREKSTIANMFYGANGNLVRSVNAPFVFRNLMDVVDVTQADELNEKFKKEMMESMTANSTVKEKDALVAKAFEFASKISFDSADGSFKMLVSPTRDPGVFDAIMELRMGQDLNDEMSLNIPKDGFSGVISEEDGMKFSEKETAKFAKDTAKSAIQAISGGGEPPEFLYQVGGIIKARVIYNFDTSLWTVQPVGGGINAGVGIKFGISIPIKLSPIPIQVGFVDINMGASVAVDYRMNMITSPQSVTYTKDVPNLTSIVQPGTGINTGTGFTLGGTVNYDWANKQADYQVDHLTNLKINAFIEVFGGLGFDYGILALKLGPFGGVGLKNENLFLNRSYLDPKFNREKEIRGTFLEVTATVGIKFEGSFIGITYTKVLCSKTWNKQWKFDNWQKIAEYWYATTGEKITSFETHANSKMGLMAAEAYANYTGEMEVFDGGVHPESREYLSENARIWNNATEKHSLGRMIDMDGGAPKAVLQNAYPNAAAQISNDGQLFVFLDDQENTDTTKTRLAYAKHNGSGYDDKGVVNEGGFGDNSPNFDGNATFGAATWVRLGKEPPKLKAEESLTVDQQNGMVNNTEVMVSLYNGNTWVTKQLTNNGSPDLTPVVAVGDDEAIVAWRGTLLEAPKDGATTYADDKAALPFQFGNNDIIQYCTYDKQNDAWSEVKVLYDASAGGKVMGLSAGVMDDGTMAIAYCFDAGGEDGAGQEIVCTVLDRDGAVKTNTRVTNNLVRDENPQLAVVNFAEKTAEKDWRFVLGYNHQGDKNTDVEISSFDKNGLLRDDLSGSVSEMSGGNPVPDLFRFAGMDGDKRTLDNLTIIWTEGSNNGNTIGSDKLRAVQFVVEREGEESKIYTSAAMPLADLPESDTAHTISDGFDAYISDDHEAKALIMATEYDSENMVLIKGEVMGEDDVKIEADIPVPHSETHIYSATQKFQNAAEITNITINPQDIKADFDLPVSITIRNNGMEPISSAVIKIDEEEYNLNDLALYPGLSQTVAILHPLSAITKDLTYSGKVTFGSDKIVALTGDGGLRLTVPNVGISKAEVITAEEGVRNIAVSLYNASDYKLKGTDNVVKIGLYSSSGYEKEYEKAVITLSDDDLKMLDEGAYTAVLSFKLGEFLKGEDGTQNEIPAGGLTFFLKAWTEDKTSALETVEYFPTDNASSVHFESPKANNNGKKVVIEVNQSEEDKKTTAELTLSSTIMAAQHNGNVIVNLIDQNGKVIESELLADTAFDLKGEGVVRKPVQFSTTGARIEASYFTAAADGVSEAELSMLDISGHDVAFDINTAEYDIITEADETTLTLTAVATAKNAVVSVKGNPSVSEGGKLSCEIPVFGKVELTVTNGEGETAKTKTYVLNMKQKPADGISLPSYTITATAGEGGKISPSGKLKVDEGDSTTFKFTPNEGYEVAFVRVNGADVGAVTSHKLTNIKSNMSIEVIFKKIGQWANPFSDVNEKDWYYEAVKYASEQSFMKGTTTDGFAPMQSTTRAMTMTMLYRLAGSPQVKADEDLWYSKGRAWAMEQGVSDGTNPEGILSREQLVTILYRYSKAAVVSGDKLAGFADVALVSQYAKDAMAWAVHSGIVQGDGGKLNPQGSASRAEVATIFMRFQKSIAK